MADERVGPDRDDDDTTYPLARFAGASLQATARLDGLPVVLTVPEAAKVLRIGRNQLYDAIARGDVEALRIGRSLRVPRAVLIRLLGEGSAL